MVVYFVNFCIGFFCCDVFGDDDVFGRGDVCELGCWYEIVDGVEVGNVCLYYWVDDDVFLVEFDFEIFEVEI